MADIVRELVRDQVEKEVARQTAVKALESQAAVWEKKALDGTYSLQKDLLDFYVIKAKAARDEAARLKGELG